MTEREERRERLKQGLLERKRGLWAELRDELFGKLGKEYREQFDTSLDIEELSVIDLIEDTGLKVVDIKREELTRIDEALDAIEEGRYGTCSGCFAEIDDKRLEVEPFATMCTECRSRSEGE